MRINTILNLVYFNVLGQVEDLKKDTESIKEGVKGIEERMEMFIQGNEYNAGKGKENIVNRKLINHLPPGIGELYIAGFCFTLIVLLNPDCQKKFKEST